MPSNLLAIDADFPTYTGEEPVEDQLRGLTNYLYQLRESLQYSLQNLSADNFNAAALQNLSDSQKNEITKQLELVYKELTLIQGEIRQLWARVPDSESMANDLKDLQEAVTGEGGLADRLKALEEDETLGNLQDAVTGEGGLADRLKALEEDETLGNLQEVVTGEGGLADRVKALEEDETLGNLQEAVTGEGGLAEQVDTMKDELSEIGDILKTEEDGSVSLGGDGKDLHLVGNIYINGILFEQGVNE